MRAEVQAAGGIVRRIVEGEIQVALVHRPRYDDWSFPKGKVDEGESSLEAAVREVLEETGLRVEPEALTGVYKNMRRGIIALVFRCRIIDGEPHATNEAQEIAWLPPDQVRERMHEAYATRLLDALDSGHPAVRAHDGLTLLPA